MKKSILTLLITIPLVVSGCYKTSYQSFMDGLTVESNPEDAVRWQASQVQWSLKTQSVSFRDDAQKLLDVVGESTIDLSSADHAIQTYVYLAALSNKNTTYNRKIDTRIVETIDKLCLPSAKLSYKIADIEKLSDAYYQYHLAQACQAIFQGRSAAKDVSLALMIGQEDCTFSGQTPRSFMSEILECRLQRESINITGMLPNTEEQ